MTTSPDFDDDLLNSVRSTPQAPRPDLRGEILAQTQGVLRRRRYLRRAGYALALAGCYVAGILTMSLATPVPPALARQDQPAPWKVASLTPAPAPQETVLESSPERDRHAVAKNRQAVTPVRQTRFEKLRKAADRALVEQGDMMSAVKLYKKALDVAKPEELAISAERDNWLLISLKEARLQEKQNAKQG
jgi:hypothetical protein